MSPSNWPLSVRRALMLIATSAGSLGPAACSASTRVVDPGACAAEGEMTCEGDTLVTCRNDGGLLVEDRQTCDPGACTERGCVVCEPETRFCDGNDVFVCSDDGTSRESLFNCDATAEVCALGECFSRCDAAAALGSSEGCSFHPVMLDNAERPALSVLIANGHAFPVQVSLEDPFADGPVVTRTVDGRSTAVVDVPDPLRVDGVASGDGFDETHSARVPAGLRLVTDNPVTAYQFNPLRPGASASVDASTLLPTAILGTAYTVVGWPQLLGAADPVRFRASTTVVATEDETSVIVELGPAAATVVGVDGAESYGPGSRVELRLDALDVLNLETDAVGADFSGTTVLADRPVAVFTGHEAGDVPEYDGFVDRPCCGDHLEGQLLPDTVLGSTYVLAREPSRPRAVARAGGSGGPTEAPSPDRVRVVAVEEGTTTVTTDLPSPFDRFDLRRGETRTVPLTTDTVLEATAKVAVAQFFAGQSAVDIPATLPGGDPSLLIIPPVSRFRSDYVVSTPTGFSFDFITIIAPSGATPTLDGEPVDGSCEPSAVPGEGSPFVVHRCQLGRPRITGDELAAGEQDDGTHLVSADEPVGVLVSGFDAFVSYAYPGGLAGSPLR